MRISFKHIVFALLAVVVLSASAYAQRDRKKKPDESQGQEARLREAEFFFTEGEKYFILEDYTKALLYFQRVAELNPKSAAVQYKIAEILAKGNRQEDMIKASQSIETALKLDRKNKYYYLLAANIYGSLNQYEKAELTIEAMMKEVSGTEEYLYELAAFYLYDKKPEKAVDVYNRAEQLMGINEVSSMQKQKIYLELGKTEEAIREGEKLVDAYPDEERYVMELAETLSKNKLGARAIALIEKYIADNPDASTSKLLLAGIYRESGQEQKSREMLTALFDDPNIEAGSKILVLGTYNVVLSKQVAKGQIDPALESYVSGLVEKLKKNYPNDPDVFSTSGDINTTLSNNTDAQKDYLKAIRLGATDFEAWQNLLVLESTLNQFDSLIAHSESGLELFPNQALLYYFNGYAHMRKRHYREASGSLEQAKRLSASNQALVAEINAMLGDIYNGTREYTKSDNAYEQALAFNPNNDLVLNNYSYYLALRKENLERAEKMAAQLIKIHPKNASYLDTYAWVLFMREKYKEARRAMETAIATGDAGATHFEHYGDILFKLGETDDAVRQWQKAKSMDGDNEAIDKKIANRRLY
ncbi:MAG TPA: tetratricopeptide repeat protein [Cyclobacteriaceae bacterium]|nr:tetratricopeptide repeat protein [Cyclobacteriaceae bacterium]